jgi:uridylate kinase
MSSASAVTAYKRVLLKVSGEAFASKSEMGVDMEVVSHLAAQIARCVKHTQLAIVVGGGNIIRGSKFSSQSAVIQESTAHYMGMLGTVINGLALQDALEHIGCETRLMTAIRMDGVAEPFIRRRCTRHLERGRVVILACGSGQPFVTTDTAAALRACEISADMLLKATKVDGVYSDDPVRNPHAVYYERLTYQQVLEQNLRVMDMTAIGLCLDNKLPINVFNYLKEGNIERAVAGERVGTIVSVT